MPLLQVFGYENHYSNGSGKLREEFNQKLREALASTEGLRITPKQVSIVHSGDIDSENGLILIIRGLFVREERTLEVKNEACENIKNALLSFRYLSRDIGWIEVWTESTDPSLEGFADYKNT
ncbi:hypothetical protein KC842_00820 [Candidatus Nomurabacteria bacterium]|nr:hypothetical protein [Candidatus Nomurabacteria bacterium]